MVAYYLKSGSKIIFNDMSKCSWSIIKYKKILKQFPKEYMWYHPSSIKKNEQSFLKKDRNMCWKNVPESSHQNDNNGYLRKLPLCAF